jgi:hypothetical protein
VPTLIFDSCYHSLIPPVNCHSSAVPVPVAITAALALVQPSVAVVRSQAGPRARPAALRAVLQQQVAGLGERAAQSFSLNLHPVLVYI